MSVSVTTHVVAVLQCDVCAGTEQLHGKSVSAVYEKAAQRGWRIRTGGNRAVCATCLVEKPAQAEEALKV